MVDGTRELDQIQDDLEILHERSQSNKLKIATHEAACEERYAGIMLMLEKAQLQNDEMYKEIQRLSDLATQGKSSLRTLFYIGTFITSFIAIMYTITQFFPK